MWLRKNEGERWAIERKPDDQVKMLLDTRVTLTDNGFIYLNLDMQVYNTRQLVKKAEDSSLAVPAEITKTIADLLKAEKLAKQCKEQLRELMEQHGVTKWENDEFTATIGKDSTSTTFDTTRFKKEEPDLYKKYLKTSTRKGSFTLKLK